MTIRTLVAGFATAFVLGAGALLGSSLATSTSAQAAPGWHGGHGHHRAVDPGFLRRGHGGWGHHRGHGWGHRGWGYAPVGYAGYYGGCYTVLKARFVPGLGLVERPVRRCY